MDLFAGPLAQVRFPGVDQQSLRAAETEVEARRAELQAALEAVQLARGELEEAHAILFEQARRAHAYASIYAEGDDTLASALARITLEQHEPAPKKRGRPAKSKSKSQTSLSVAEDAA